MPTRLCVVRHGETAWNAARRIQGQHDVPLSATGRAQARAVGRALAHGHAPFAAVYSSDLSRARQTAELALAQPVILEAGLRERHYGVFQSLTYADMQRDHPQAYARHAAREESFAPSGGGESLLHFAQRIGNSVETIARAHPGEQILVVTHGGALDVLHRLATGRALSAPRNFDIPNAALNWLEFSKGAWKLLAWAEQGHLAAALDELTG